MKNEVSAKAFPSTAIVSAYTIVALIYCALSSVLYFRISYQPIIAWIHILAFAGVATHYFLVRNGENINVGTHIILFVGTLVVGSQFISGGWENSGMMWTFGYLPYAYFLGNTYTTRLWVGVLAAIYGIVGLMDLVSPFDLPYSFPMIVVFYGCLAVFLICMTAYQVYQVKYLKVISDYQHKMETANEQLKSEVGARKQSEADLMKKTKELERLNSMMVGRELKMSELKKQIKEDNSSTVSGKQ